MTHSCCLSFMLLLCLRLLFIVLLLHLYSVFYYTGCAFIMLYAA